MCCEGVAAPARELQARSRGAGWGASFARHLRNPRAPDAFRVLLLPASCPRESREPCDVLTASTLCPAQRAPQAARGTSTSRPPWHSWSRAKSAWAATWPPTLVTRSLGGLHLPWAVSCDTCWSIMTTSIPKLRGSSLSRPTCYRWRSQAPKTEIL